MRGELHQRFADRTAQRAGSTTWTSSSDTTSSGKAFHLSAAQVQRLDGSLVALAQRAGDRLADAGRRAFARGDANAAAKLLSRSTSICLQPWTPSARMCCWTSAARSSESGDFAAAERALDGALEQARAMNAEALTARTLIELSHRTATCRLQRARVADMLDVAKRAIVVFKRDPSVTRVACRVPGCTAPRRSGRAVAARIWRRRSRRRSNMQAPPASGATARASSASSPGPR